MSIENCSKAPDALLSLIEEIKLCYQAPPPTPKRGRKPDFTELSFLLLAVVAVVTGTFSDSALHRLLLRDSELRAGLGFERVPHRTRLGKRLRSLVAVAEQQIRNVGTVIVAEVEPGASPSEVSAIDGRMYQADGPKWPHKDRLKGVLPIGLRNVDQESKWSKSGYRGWVQGYRLILQALCFPEPVPLFAVWRENQLNEARIALEELEKGQLPVTAVLLGDTLFGQEAFAAAYQKAGGYVLTPRQLPKKRRSWKNDLYGSRKETIELLFQRIMQAFEFKSCPGTGKAKNGVLVFSHGLELSSLLVEQLSKEKESGGYQTTD